MSCLCDWNPLSNHWRMKAFPPSRPPPRPPFISTAVPAAATQRSKLPPLAPCRAPVCREASGNPACSWGAPGWPGPGPAPTQAASARPRTADLVPRCPSRAWQGSSQTGGAWVRPAEPLARPPAPPPGSLAPCVSSASRKVPSGPAVFKPGFVLLRGEGASGDAVLRAPPAWQGLPGGLGSAVGFYQRCLKHTRGAAAWFVEGRPELLPTCCPRGKDSPQGFLPACVNGLAPRLLLSLSRSGSWGAFLSRGCALFSPSQGGPHEERSTLQGGVGHAFEPGPVLGVQQNPASPDFQTATATLAWVGHGLVLHPAST